MPEPTPTRPVKTQRVRPWKEMADSLDRALDDALARGAQINKNCRLREYTRVMRATGASYAIGAHREEMSLIRCEVDEIVSALDHLRADPEVEGWTKLLERVQGGPLFPQPFHDKSRAAQVELFMAGAMRSTGTDILLREPDDAIAVMREGVVHFEAKRPNSEKRLRQSVREARNQLARRGEYGALFIDLNQLGTIQNEVIEVIDYDDAHREIEPRLWNALARFGVNAPDWVRGTSSKGENVLAIFGVVRGRFVIMGEDGLWHHGFIHAIRIERMVSAIADVPVWFREFAESLGRINQPPNSPTLT
jgi:hypothetical protein